MSIFNRRQVLRFALAACALPAAASIAAADGHTTTHTVTIKSFKFSPAKLTIKAGDTVVFINADGATHTATAKNRSFDTGNLSKGKQAAVSFKKAGKFDYICDLHPAMKGSITVQ